MGRRRQAARDVPAGEVRPPARRIPIAAADKPAACGPRAPPPRGESARHARRPEPPMSARHTLLPRCAFALLAALTGAAQAIPFEVIGFDDPARRLRDDDCSACALSPATRRSERSAAPAAASAGDPRQQGNPPCPRMRQMAFVRDPEQPAAAARTATSAPSRPTRRFADGFNGPPARRPARASVRIGPHGCSPGGPGGRAQPWYLRRGIVAAP